MRVLVDTNIMISALMFPKSKVANVLLHVTNYHEMVLSDQNIKELREVIGRKRQDLLPDVEVLLAEMSYELIPATYHAEKMIRDAKDQPILNAAIVYDVDYILTGDKDFLTLNMEHPKCITVSDYMIMEGIE